jgi:hypothetical protein
MKKRKIKINSINIKNQYKQYIKFCNSNNLSKNDANSLRLFFAKGGA